MNAKGYFEEMTVTEEAPKLSTEADRARNWFNTVEIVDGGTIAEFFKYEVSIGAHNETFYLFTKSPQRKAMGRRSMGDCIAKGKNKEDLRGGFERFLSQMEAKKQRHTEKVNAKRDARETFVNPYKVGDFLYSSWGYEQTNREFYQVLEVGKNSLKIQEVYQNRTRDSHDSGTCEPRKDEFRNPAQWVTIQIFANGYHSIPSPIHGNLYPYENKPVYFSDGY